MWVTIFHGMDVNSNARDNKQLTSSKSKGKDTLHIIDKEMLVGIKVKSEVIEPKRLTLYREDVVSTRPDVSKTYDGHKKKTSNQDPWEECFEAGLPKRRKISVSRSQYGGNGSRRHSHHGDKHGNGKDRKRNHLGWQSFGLDQRVSKNQIYKDLMNSFKDLIVGPETNNGAHGRAFLLDTDDTSTKHL